MQVDIRSKQPVEGGLWVNAEVTTPKGTYCSPCLIGVPADADDLTIKVAIAATYGLIYPD